jgi:putative membrane protein
MIEQKSDDLPDGSLHPRVIVVEKSSEAFLGRGEHLSPRVIPTTQSGRVVTAAPVEPWSSAPVTGRPRRLISKFALTGLITALCGWLTVDLYLWIQSAFEFSNGLGWTAVATVTLAVAAAGLIIAHEMRSYLALKNVEANQQRLDLPWQTMRPSDTQDAIRSVIAAVPVNDETKAALRAFQRKVQRHHSPGQQIEIFSQSVMTPLDRRAEAIVRMASARAFGITAISPTAITDVVFFVACSVRMVREIAGCYGHRPTALATAHLLRRLVVEAGKLGAVDFAGATLTQHVGGAIAERVATSAAESMYAAQRMARLGLVTMGMCRPIPFRRHELPSITSSLIGNLFPRSPPT